MNNKNVLRACCVLILSGALSGCATSYQSKGFTGGFTDTRIDDITWRVRFDGNGYAKQERVWNYWLYRCAELTISKGYNAMSIETRRAETPGAAPYSPQAPLGPSPALPANPPSSSFSPADAPARIPTFFAGMPGDGQGTAWRMMKTPAGRADAEQPRFMPVAARAPTYIYVPGQTITTWHADGIVHMFNENSVPVDVRYWLRPSRIIELLKAYVDSDGKAVAPSREYILGQSSVLVRKPPVGTSF